MRRSTRRLTNVSTREWTGSTKDVAGSLHAMAQEFASRAMAARDLLAVGDEMSVDELRGALDRLGTYMQDHAYTLNEWGDAVEQLYVRLDAKGSSASVMTNAQGVALAARFTERTLSINVTQGSFGVPKDYVYGVARDRQANVADFHFGIDPEGRVSS
jgi:hypothetical protein